MQPFFASALFTAGRGMESSRYPRGRMKVHQASVYVSHMCCTAAGVRLTWRPCVAEVGQNGVRSHWGI